MSDGRKDQIRQQLDWLLAHNTLRSWYSYAPGESRGQRWVLEISGGYDRTFTTREVEIFILGADAGRVEEALRQTA